MKNPLIEKYLTDNPVILFDVGAKGGTFELPKLSQYIKCFAFEPNPYEFKKLADPREIKQIKYAEKQNFQLALSDKVGQTELYITNKSSYSSLLEFDVNRFGKHLGLMPKYDEWKSDFRLLEKVSVRTTTLTEFCKIHNLTKIDFLKLDTQGKELDILLGGKELLENVGVIKCEVNFMPVYKGQNVFSEIDSFLRRYDFEFVDCIFYPDVTYDISRGPTKNKIYDKPRYSTGGDAVYIKNIDKLSSDDYLFKLGIIMAELGYLSESHSCLSKHSEISTEGIDTILKTLTKKNILNKIKDLLREWMPPRLISILKNTIHK
jgi:FkbM family methyltransferase